MSILNADLLGMNRSEVHAGPLKDDLEGVLKSIDGLLLLHADKDEDDFLSFRGGVVRQALLLVVLGFSPWRRVGVSGPGVEIAMLDLDLQGVNEEQVVMGRGLGLMGCML